MELFQKSAINSFYLGDEIGKKLIIFMFSLHPNVIDRLHEAIKFQLTVSKPYIVSAYAQIYFQVYMMKERKY